MGMLVTVYRPADQSWGDTTRGGISSRATSLVVVNVPGPFVPSDNAPAAWFTDRSDHRLPPIIHPAELNEQGEWQCVDTLNNWYMAGGNFAATSDSRWARCVEKFGVCYPHAVAIHDRNEPWPT